MRVVCWFLRPVSVEEQNHICWTKKNILCVESKASFSALMQPPPAAVWGQTPSKTAHKQSRNAGFWAPQTLDLKKKEKKTSKQSPKPPWPCLKGQTAAFITEPQPCVTPAIAAAMTLRSLLRKEKQLNKVQLNKVQPQQDQHQSLSRLCEASCSSIATRCSHCTANQVKQLTCKPPKV